MSKTILIVFALLLLSALPARATDTRFVDWLYMEPNEGGSSAGHVAVAFGDRTYAFQRSPAGRLVLERDGTEHARWRYAVLGNRPIHRSRVAVSEVAFERLREGFNRRYLIEQEDLARLDRLAAARQLFRLLLARARDRDVTDGLAIEGGGYFRRSPSRASSPALSALGAAVVAAHGADFVADRLAALRATLAALAPDAGGDVHEDIDEDVDDDVNDERFAARYLATTTAILALEVLRDAPPLDAEAIRSADDVPLDTNETAALARYAERLTTELTRLAASIRSDFGFPLLIGMARLAALERSLATGRLIVLDAYPVQAARLPYALLMKSADAARGLRDDACADLVASRHRFVGTPEPSEREYARLESAANRCLELTRAIADGRDVRLSGDALVPTRPSSVTALVVPTVPVDRLAAAERRAADGAEAAVRDFDDRHRYDLVRRNCVTETFRTIDDVLGPEAAEALGARLTPDGGLRMIPAVSNRAVARRWRVAASDTMPSYRQARVAAMTRTGNPLAVRLRESNVLTSTVYRPSRDDSTFLFFTDDVRLLRPLLGAANLGVGIGASVLGLPRAPFDSGTALGAGLRGVLWSLPELVFLNVRKGSFDHVARNDPPAAPPSRESPPPSPR